MGNMLDRTLRAEGTNAYINAKKFVGGYFSVEPEAKGARYFHSWASIQGKLDKKKEEKPHGTNKKTVLREKFHAITRM